MTNIIPAILTADILDVQHKLEQLQGLTNWVQIDIMDNSFVKNSTVTLKDLSSLEIVKEFSLEAHLMVSHPEAYFSQCQKNNIKRVIFHMEACESVKSTLLKAQEFNFEKALAINPETSVQELLPYIDSIDVVLLMSVNPGLQGQEFIESTLHKIEELRTLAPDIKIEVDGGVNLENIGAVAKAGADTVVVGSGLFAAEGEPRSGRESENIKERFLQLQSKLS